MFQTKFNTTLQMFFIKLSIIFFQKPPKTLNICIFPCTIRYLQLEYFVNVWENTGINLTGILEKPQNQNAEKQQWNFKLP